MKIQGKIKREFIDFLSDFKPFSEILPIRFEFGKGKMIATASAVGDQILRLTKQDVAEAMTITKIDPLLADSTVRVCLSNVDGLIKDLSNFDKDETIHFTMEVSLVSDPDFESKEIEEQYNYVSTFVLSGTEIKSLKVDTASHLLYKELNEKKLGASERELFLSFSLNSRNMGKIKSLLSRSNRNHFTCISTREDGVYLVEEDRFEMKLSDSAEKSGLGLYLLKKFIELLDHKSEYNCFSDEELLVFNDLDGKTTIFTYFGEQV